MTQRRLLIVDDDQYVRVLLARMIEPLNHELTSAENGQVALEHALRTPFDLIITDWKMPVMDGLTLIENLRTRAIDSGVILLTAHADLDRVLEEGTRLNISSFLMKPIHSLEQLHFDIQAAISRRDLERENRSLMRSLRDANTSLEQRIAERTRQLAEKNEELNQISQFRADLLKILGHELHTPLAIMQGYLQLASDAFPAENNVFLSQIGHSVERLKDIAKKALLLAQAAGASQFPLNPGTVTPAELCRSVIDRLRPLVAGRSIELRLVEAQAIAPCRWDAGRVEYIVEELLVNAVRASRDGGAVTVRLGTEGDAVTIEVIDEGVGLTDPELSRVFEPFVTLGSPQHHTSGQFGFRAQGLGIGLPTARMLAELHGGSLTAVHNPGGQGTVFKLTLRERRRAAATAGRVGGVSEPDRQESPSA